MYNTYCFGLKNRGEAAATERIVKRIATLNYNKDIIIINETTLDYFS